MTSFLLRTFPTWFFWLTITALSCCLLALISRPSLVASQACLATFAPGIQLIQGIVASYNKLEI